MKKTLLEEILVTETNKPVDPRPMAGVVLGRLVALGSDGQAMVDYPGNPTGRPLPAVATARFAADDIGTEIALLFENGNLECPVVIGPLLRPEADTRQPEIPEASPPKQTVAIDGETMIFTAEKEIVLRCGAASITLTRSGKILIRGKYLLSRSSGVNRVKGGSIQLN